MLCYQSAADTKKCGDDRLTDEDKQDGYMVGNITQTNSNKSLGSLLQGTYVRSVT